MKSLRVFSLLFTLFCLASQSSIAQTKAAHLSDEQKEEMARQVEEYFTTLDLSEEQKPQFKAITKKYAEQMIVVRDSGEGKMKKYKKVKAIQKDKNAEMKELLSDDQYSVYLEKQEEMRKKMKERRKQN